MLSKLNMQVLELSYFIDELVIDLPQAIFLSLWMSLVWKSVMADNKTAKSVLFLSSLTLSFSFCILKFNLCLCKQYLVELGLLIYPNDPSISIAHLS